MVIAHDCDGGIHIRGISYYGHDTMSDAYNPRPSEVYLRKEDLLQLIYALSAVRKRLEVTD